MDGKHSMRLQNVNVYVWTGPKWLIFAYLPQFLLLKYNFFKQIALYYRVNMVGKYYYIEIILESMAYR